MSYFVKTAFLGTGVSPDPSIFDAIKAKSPVPIQSSHPASYFAPGGEPGVTSHINIDPKALFPENDLAHEVGHALHGNTSFGGFTQSQPMSGAQDVTLLTSPITAAAISGSGAHRGWHALGYGLNMLPTVAGLFNEHRATSLGRGLMEQVGANASRLTNYDNDLSEAFGTYLTDAGGRTIHYGLGMGVGELIRHYRSKGKSEAERRLGLKQLPE